jgi:hypothetical protein
MENTPQKELFDLLVTRDLDIETLDSSGKPVEDPSEAELLSFDWKTPAKNYGTVVILFDNNNSVELYFGDNLGKSMEGDDKQQWYAFLEQIKKFSTRNLLNFRVNNLNRLKYTMKGMAAIREGLFEGYYGKKKNISYSDQPKQTRLMIKHSRDLGEGEARYRAIESLFIETAEGERFRVPSRNLTHGKLLARHVSEGGTPYDLFGNHINEMVNELSVLSRFLRASDKRDYDEKANRVREAAIRHYQALKTKTRKMLGQRGYREEREKFDPSAVDSTQPEVENIRNMFVERNIDHRIEEALPVLARVAGTLSGQAVSDSDYMEEVNEFDSWTQRMLEGTWALPDTPQSRKQLEELLAQPLPVGPDASNVTSILDGILGDDELFDRLGELAKKDADADARPLIQDRLSELGIDIDIPDNQQPTDENLDTDGVMMTRPSNMSSESIERHLARLLELAKK